MSVAMLPHQSPEWRISKEAIGAGAKDRVEMPIWNEGRNTLKDQRRLLGEGYFDH